MTAGAKDGFVMNKGSEMLRDTFKEVKLKIPRDELANINHCFS
jgi:hypothetical protein